MYPRKFLIPFLLGASVYSSDLLAYKSGDGIKFDVTYNENGAVLKSRRSTIYMGKNCDVSSPEYGTGTWSWGSKGFKIDFGGKSISFPKQKINIGDNDKCKL